MPRDAVLIPLKSFATAKDRLRQGGQRDVSALAEGLALGVLRGLRSRPIYVLGDSEDVEAFAHRHGVGYWPSPSGLNPTVTSAYQGLGDDFERLFIVHGDLHTSEGLGEFDPVEDVTIATDRHQKGTNVLVLPTGLAFHFSYGPDSKDRHLREAERLGLSWRVIVDSPWALDIDEPSDVELSLQSHRGGPGAPSTASPRTD
ncbi:MAG: hypothetical protein WAN30_01015 [Acidimicrobiales bacterium]